VTNDQRSLNDQLNEAAALADGAGLYDAADYIRERVRDRHDADAPPPGADLGKVK